MTVTLLSFRERCYRPIETRRSEVKSKTQGESNEKAELVVADGSFVFAWHHHACCPEQRRYSQQWPPTDEHSRVCHQPTLPSGDLVHNLQRESDARGH